MIRLTLGIENVGGLPAEELRGWLGGRHLPIAKRMERLQRLAAGRVVASGAADAPDAVLEAWWDSADDARLCFAAPGGLAYLGERMVSTEGPIPNFALATLGSSGPAPESARIDPGATGQARIAPRWKLVVPAAEPAQLDAMVREAGTGDLDLAIHPPVRESFSLGYRITGIEPPALPSADLIGVGTMDLWFDTEGGAVGFLGSQAWKRLEEASSDIAPWLLLESTDVFMSRPVASFLVEESDEA